MTLEELSSRLDALEIQFAQLQETVTFHEDQITSHTRRLLNLEEAHE